MVQKIFICHSCLGCSNAVYDYPKLDKSLREILGKPIIGLTTESAG